MPRPNFPREIANIILGYLGTNVVFPGLEENKNRAKFSWKRLCANPDAPMDFLLADENRDYLKWKWLVGNPNVPIGWILKLENFGMANWFSPLYDREIPAGIPTFEYIDGDEIEDESEIMKDEQDADEWGRVRGTYVAPCIGTNISREWLRKPENKDKFAWKTVNEDYDVAVKFMEIILTVEPKSRSIYGLRSIRSTREGIIIEPDVSLEWMLRPENASNIDFGSFKPRDEDIPLVIKTGSCYLFAGWPIWSQMVKYVVMPILIGD
jgi:hypothetical protein